MSKLAHSSDEHMAEIERRAAIDAGELRRCTVCEAENTIDNPECPRDGIHCNIVTVRPTRTLFTAEDDYVTRARVDHWFQAAPGSLVQTPDGRLWTVVYNNLDGYGVVEGDQPQYIGAPNDDLPPPTHMLREPYRRHPTDSHVEFVGDLVRVIRRVKPDNTVEDRSFLLNARVQS